MFNLISIFDEQNHSMDSSKYVFTIGDLERLSGIKAHTIRIWEKRYNVLEPGRSENNVRFYNVTGLQKLMNIKLLHSHGYKISKIARFPEEKIPAVVREIVSDKSVASHAMNAFIMSVVTFDKMLFSSTYQALLTMSNFESVFTDVFIPLLNRVGLLWQENTINQAHEHFISNLVRQKLIVNIERIQFREPERTDKNFVFFLPVGESHDMALLYMNYLAVNASYRTIYLGSGISFDHLEAIRKYYGNLVFVSYITSYPDENGLKIYITEFGEKLLKDNEFELWLSGQMTRKYQDEELHPKTKILRSLREFKNAIE